MPPAPAKRVFVAPLPQPFQPGEVAALAIGGDAVHLFSVAAVVAIASRAPRPAAKSATAVRSVADSVAPCTCIRPLVSELRIDSAGRARSAAGVGAEVWPSAWQLAHALANTAAPSTPCATAPVAPATTSAMHASVRFMTGLPRGRSLVVGRSSLLNAERQQNIPRVSDESPVSRIEVNHPAGDDGAGALQAAALGLHAVHRRELAVGVEGPQDLAVHGGVGAHAAVERS